MDVLKELGKNIASLVDLKSFVTMAMVGTLCYLVITGAVEPAVFMTICTMVLQYYFNKKPSADQQQVDSTEETEDHAE